MWKIIVRVYFLYGIVVVFSVIITCIWPEIIPYSSFTIILGFLIVSIIKMEYRNKYVRHHYEKETPNEVLHMKKTDDKITKRYGLTSTDIKGRNDY